MVSRPRPFVVATCALLFFGTPVGAQDLDLVELDVVSGTTSTRLPFDVPFLLVGEAPRGSIRLELWCRGVHQGVDEPLGETPLITAIGADGRFRSRLGPFGPNREFRFVLVFDRRLSSRDAAELRRDLESTLDRRLAEVSNELSELQAEVLGGELRLALERTLNQGIPIGSARGQIAVEARGRLFSEVASPDELLEEMNLLVRDVLARQAERRESLRRLRETVPGLEEDLAALRSNVALLTLVRELERRPELDPRNPRNELFLSDDANRLIKGSDADLVAIARGRSLSDSPIDLESSFHPEDADAVRSRYLRTARSLREIREWLQSLVTPGAANRATFDDVRAGSSDLGEADARNLLNLANDENSVLRRAEDWAEVLEVYTYDLQKALLARERALAELGAEIESRALSTRIRHTVNTEVLTTAANLYVGLDLGAMYSPELERAAGYFGANIYFAPVNKKASLSYAGGLKKRLSMTFGLTLTDLVLEDDPRIEPLLGSRYNLVLGLGYRFARSVRVSGGTLLVLKNDPNPLVTDRSLAWTPYVGFSFDIDVVGSLRAAAR